MSTLSRSFDCKKREAKNPQLTLLPLSLLLMTTLFFIFANKLLLPLPGIHFPISIPIFSTLLFILFNSTLYLHLTSTNSPHSHDFYRGFFLLLSLFDVTFDIIDDHCYFSLFFRICGRCSTNWLGTLLSFQVIIIIFRF